MLVHLILAFVNLLFFLCYSSVGKLEINYDIIEILNRLTLKTYEFSEWALTFVFLFIIIPSSTICMILITFKIYTHDFIKPIQKSYLMVVHSYLTCLMFCKLFSDILLKYTQIIYKHKNTLAELQTKQIVVNLLSIYMFFIIFIVVFFFAEAFIASTLNSIPLKSMGICKKNLGCIIFCLLVLLCYSSCTFNLCHGVSRVLDSCMSCFYLLGIAVITALIINLTFFVIYLKTMIYVTNAHARIYREFIAV